MSIIEELFVEMLANNKTPKTVRYIFVILLIALISFVGIMIGVNSHELIGWIIGLVPAIAFIILGVYLIIKIYKS